MKWIVIWDQTAVDDLAQVWLEANDRKAVTMLHIASTANYKRTQTSKVKTSTAIDFILTHQLW